MQHRFFVLCGKLKRQSHTILHRLDACALGDQGIHVLFDDLFDQAGNVLKVIIERVAIDSAILHNTAYADFG